MIEFDTPGRPKNLNAGRPLHYEKLDGGLWGGWIVETAKDVAGWGVLTYMEEADADFPPSNETYWAATGDGVWLVRWWNPTAFGRISTKFTRPVAGFVQR